jgi:hypothetical protein
VVAATAVVLAATIPATAAISVLNTFAAGENNFQDTSADHLVNMLGGAKTVDVGDVLICAFAFNTVQNSQFPIPTAIGTGSASYGELSGLLALKVLSKGGGPGGILTPWNWTFGPATDAASVAAIAAISANAGAEVGGWNAGTLAAFYSDLTPDYSRNGLSVNADVATAIDGTQLWQVGFTNNAVLDVNGSPTAQNGEGWIAFGAPSDDITAIGAIPPPGNGGIVNFSLRQTAVTPYSGLLNASLTSIFNPLVSSIELNGSANLLGVSQPTSWNAFDNADMNINIVPEPASLIVWSLLGLAGLAVWSRQRRVEL